MSPADKAMPSAPTVREAAHGQQTGETVASEAATNENQRLLHELQVHQIELETQNESLRQIHAELEASRDMYENLYEFAPMGYLTLSPQGTIEKLNLTAAVLLGAERKALTRRNFINLVSAEDQPRWASFLTHFKSQDDKGTLELSLRRSDNTALQVQVDCVWQVSVLLVAITDITIRKQVVVALEVALNDKTALLNEVHHRVKNNLQVVASLLSLEAARSPNLATITVLKDMQGRIRSMALLHEMLYRSGVFASVDLSHYIKQLATEAFRAMATTTTAVSLQLHLTQLDVVMDQALSCGLLVNELLSNCLKHSFPNGAKGVVTVELELTEGVVHLSVSDTGIGLSPDFILAQQKSLGLHLVADLARQLGGELQIKTGQGAAFIVTFRPKT